MRYLIALALCFFLVPTQTFACWWSGNQNSLFFESIPSLQTDADVVAEVTLLDVSVLEHYKGTAAAKVVRVIKTADERIRQGSIITMKYLVSSCGPSPRKGDEGTVIANVGADSKGSLVLYPYMLSDAGRITFPSKGE